MGVNVLPNKSSNGTKHHHRKHSRDGRVGMRSSSSSLNGPKTSGVATETPSISFKMSEKANDLSSSTSQSHLRQLRKRTGNHLDGEKKSDREAVHPRADRNSKHQKLSKENEKSSSSQSPSSSSSKHAERSPVEEDGLPSARPDDLKISEKLKRPPVKLTVKFKEGKKPCQVHVVNSSVASAARTVSPSDKASSDVRSNPASNDAARLPGAYAKTESGESPETANRPKRQGIEKVQIQNVQAPMASSKSSPAATATAPTGSLSIHMSSAELVREVEMLGHFDGEISTSVFAETDEAAKDVSKLDPPKIPKVALTKEELSPPTPCVFVKTKEEAFSPQLFELCLKRPIVVVRNLAPLCGIDMTLYGTKTLVETHPNHPLEIRNQAEQLADENWDENMEKEVWYCTSYRSHSTIAKYAEYQAETLDEAYKEELAAADGDPKLIDMAKLINPVHKKAEGEKKMIKFGTNCDLSDRNMWEPQLRELDKLPAWARVVSAGNMLSHLGHQILGMNTVQLYMKVPKARTPGHQENNNFCAVNLNVGPGDSEWFGVPNEYWGGLQTFCKKNNVDFLHGSWWPKVSELQELGIPVYRFMQKPGDLVWVNTGCVHWVQAAGWCNNIAWNVGPLTSFQYQMAMDRYEWNKTQKFQSIVAMVFLTWTLARNIQPSNVALHAKMRTTLMHSIRRIVQTLNFVRSNGVKVRFHGRRPHESAHYCGICDEEVFNVLLVKECEKRHVVHCLKCARQPTVGGKDLKDIVALVEYPLKELLEIYDNFVLVKEDHVKAETAIQVSKPPSPTVPKTEPV